MGEKGWRPREEMEGQEWMEAQRCDAEEDWSQIVGLVVMSEEEQAKRMKVDEDRRKGEDQSRPKLLLGCMEEHEDMRGGEMVRVEVW